METARISTIIPVFNCEKYVAEAIDSVLRQSRLPDEIVVVDDGSTDETARCIQAFGASVRYVHQVNKGIGAARNKGISLATGDYLAFLDADDLWTSRKLELQENVLNQHSEVDMVFGNMTQFLSPDLNPEIAARLHCPTGEMAGISGSVMMARRAVFDVSGPFAEDVTLGEFIDWYAMACEAGLQTVSLETVLLRRRIHGSNTGMQARDSRAEYVRVLKRMLDRRRSKTHR